jgi:two-component system, NtrC family, response regulator HydG
LVGEPRKILVVDDEEPIRKGLARIVLGLGHTVEVAADAEEALQKALASPPDLMVTDLQLPGRSGLELIADLQDRGFDSTFIVLTAHGTIDSAVEATRSGVYDYLTKPVQPDRIETVILKGLERAAMRQEVVLLRREMVRAGRFQKLIGRSPDMLRLYNMIDQIAPSTAPVLITGDSGTGKEVVARAIHNLSARASGRFVAISCAAIPETLLESEILGHEKGAFTSASASRPGVFELAHQGTLFLDEIAEMPTLLQSKLLRVLEEQKVRRIGGSREIPVDVRVLAATNVNVAERLRTGELREDLYFRLNVFTLHLPPLRERMDDLSLLAQSFLEEYAQENAKPLVGFSEEALELMRRYHWPGNVRELRNAIQRAVILCRGEEIQARDLPPGVRPTIRSESASSEGGGDDGSLRISLGTPLDEVEKAVILATLASCGQNKTRAAALLGISTKTLHAKLNRYGVRDDGRPSRDEFTSGEPR